MPRHDPRPVIYPTMIVSNVVRTGRFRVRPGKWWEFSTLIVEVEELISYERLQDFLPDPDSPPAKVWRRANTSELLNAPKELFEPRQMNVRDDIDPAVQAAVELKNQKIVELKCDTSAIVEALEKLRGNVNVAAFPPGTKLQIEQPDRHLALKLQQEDLWDLRADRPEDVFAWLVGLVKRTWPEDEIYEVRSAPAYGKGIELWRRRQEGVS